VIRETFPPCLMHILLLCTVVEVLRVIERLMFTLFQLSSFKCYFRKHIYSPSH
jgi:hypothetical protein